MSVVTQTVAVIKKNAEAFGTKASRGSMKRKVFIPLIMILAPAASYGAAGAELWDNDSVSITSELPELSVTAGERTDEPVAPQILRADDLRRMNSRNVADAMRFFSGVQIKDYGGVGGVKTLDIRSMGSSHMGVFYDGLPLGNAQNGQIDLGKYSLDNIEEIALYNGQKSAIFQPARDFATSGSVYLRSRRPHFKAGERIAGSVTLRTGSFGLINPSARVDWKISDKISATANAEYTYADGRYKFRYRRVYADGRTAWDTTAVRKNGDIHSFRAEAGLFSRLAGGSWMAKGYWYESERGIPGAIVNNVWKNSQRQWDRNLFFQGNIHKDLGEKTSFMANAKYARDYMRYLNPDTTLMYTDNNFLQHETYVSATVRHTLLPWWDIATSADWQYNTLGSNLADFRYPRRHQLLWSGATALNPGNFRLRASLLYNGVWDKTHPKNRRGHSNTFSRFTPAVFAAWIPSRPMLPEIRAFWKRAFRMPTFNDLYYTDIGNSSLRPERATQTDVGLTWRIEPSQTLQWLELQADGYYNRVTDKIIAVPKGNSQYRWMMMNIGLAEITGLEIGTTSVWQFPWEIAGRLRLSYTYQKALDKSDPTDNLDEAGTYGGQIAYIPRHAGSVTGTLEWKGAEVSYSWIYVGRRWDNSSNIAVNRVEPWYTSDLSASYPLRIARSALRITLEINNLLNQQYEVIRNYPMPGRNFKLILKWDQTF